jgi:hypothetical protein
MARTAMQQKNKAKKAKGDKKKKTGGKEDVASTTTEVPTPKKAPKTKISKKSSLARDPEGTFVLGTTTS